MLKNSNFKLNWLRNGISAIIIVTLLMLIMAFIFSISSGGKCTDICTVGECKKSFKICFFYPFLLFSAPAIFLDSLIHFHGSLQRTIVLASFIDILFYFIIGIITGELVVKIKKKLKNNIYISKFKNLIKYE